MNNRNITEKGHSRWTEIKAKGCREGKTTGSKEAGTNEAKLVREGKELKSEKMKDSELQAAKTP